LHEFEHLYQIDWRIFFTGVQAWLHGQNPYGALPPEFGAGAFAYPPTALTWLALFVPLGGLSFYVWTGLQMLLWWLLIRKEYKSQLVLLCWSPLLLHLVEGQSTLPVILVLWAASRAERRSWLWGLAIAWALTKPQVAIVPVLWQLWQDRASPLRGRLWGGIVLGTLLLALPPTLLSPGIWSDWLASLPAYRARILQMGAWQGASVVLFVLAAYLWYRSRRGGWQWWLAAAAFPQTSYYCMVALMPALNPPLLRPQSRWSLAGLALAAILSMPAVFPLQDGSVVVLLPWILCGHLLAAWMIAGGPARRAAATPRVRVAAVADEQA
jgi:hypothetical protein